MILARRTFPYTVSCVGFVSFIAFVWRKFFLANDHGILIPNPWPLLFLLLLIRLLHILSASVAKRHSDDITCQFPYENISSRSDPALLFSPNVLSPFRHRSLSLSLFLGYCDPSIEL